ncbi:MAG: hypothetical protein GC165_18760 [Armatimonadetes bacterium]|nr:hypothetical protein [Armatimonadota bacterium]
MDARAKRIRHIIFVAHLWVCIPFLAMWFMVPSTHDKIPVAAFRNIQTFLVAVIAYLAYRSWLAFRNPPKLEWEYVFPPIDVAIVSALIWLGNRDPLSNIGLLYLFPLAQAAGTLNVRWSIGVAAMVLVGAALATHGLATEEPFNTAFRYYFIFVVASLFTQLALASAKFREQMSLDRDRKHMAMEIHDGVQAHLMTLSKQLELAEMIAVQNPERAKSIASEGRETARLAADELRFLVKRMRGQTLQGGFIPALQNFVHNVTSRHELTGTIDVVGQEKILPVEVEHTAFRIAQEALTNAVRHARATEVTVTLAYQPTELELTIRDNGVGFDPTIQSEGLDGMKSRAQRLGGDLSIQSEPGQGACILCRLPYDVPAGAQARE